MKIPFLIPFLIGLFSLSGSKPASDPIREILTLQDQRSLGAGTLAGYLTHPEEPVRARAALAFANLQDSSTVAILVTQLNDRAPSVREAIAFALGQIGASSASAALMAQLEREESPGVKARLLEALGKSGGSAVLGQLLGLTTSVVNPDLEGERALSVARFAIRSVKSPQSIRFCFDLLNHEDPHVRWKALYALWRSGPHPSIDSLMEARAGDFRQMTADPSPDVRMHLATLLGRTGSATGKDLLVVLHTRELRHPEWRVQVQIARALAGIARTRAEVIPSLIELLGTRNDHVVGATLSSLNTLNSALLKGAVDGPTVVKVLKQLAEAPKAPDALRGEALIALATFFPDEFNYESWLSATDISDYLKGRLISALSKRRGEKSWQLLLTQLENENRRLARAAWDGVRDALARRFTDKTDLGLDATSLIPILLDKSRTAFARGDMALTTAVADVVRDSLIMSQVRESGRTEELVSLLMDVYDRQSSPDDVEAMQALLNAMGTYRDERSLGLLQEALRDHDRSVALAAYNAIVAIKGSNEGLLVPRPVPATYSDYDWAKLTSLETTRQLRLITTKGTVEIELLADHAPFTVLSFVRLMERQFFNGLNFHRVVPNFVIQGGDPRGDGWGGPGYSIRSEFGLAHYSRGMVGVASAGKDTEGCQFFITHSDQPHLDGRYTIFGRVISGMEVVDRIQVGDGIIRMEIGR